MDRAKRAELKRQIAALEAQLPDGVYEDPRTMTWYVKFRIRGKSTSRRTDPMGETLLTREQALVARGEWMALLDAGQVPAMGRRGLRFATYWAEYLNHARGEMSRGSWSDLGGHGRKRLLPFFGEHRLNEVDAALVREWRAEMVELVEAGEIAPKTVNNSRVALLGCLKMAASDGLIPAGGNPVLLVKPLPVNKTEPKYLKVKQIPAYLDAAPAHYRPLAEFLIGTGARVSEAIAVRPGDVDLEAGTVAIMRQRTRRAGSLATEPTKGRNFRTVEIGSRLKAMLADLLAVRIEHGREWLFEAPTPKRGPHSHRSEPVPPSRRTVLEWHQTTLEDAGLTDMPLHGLRHTAAAAWMASGHSLQFVKDQLGHSSVEVTSEYYAHLEQQFRSLAAQVTEDLIFGHDDDS